MWKVNVRWALSQESGFKDLCVQREKEKGQRRGEGRGEKKRGERRDGERRVKTGKTAAKGERNMRAQPSQGGFGSLACRDPAVGQVVWRHFLGRTGGVARPTAAPCGGVKPPGASAGESHTPHCQWLL